MVCCIHRTYSHFPPPSSPHSGGDSPYSACSYYSARRTGGHGPSQALSGADAPAAGAGPSLPMLYTRSNLGYLPVSLITHALPGVYSSYRRGGTIPCNAPSMAGGRNVYSLSAPYHQASSAPTAGTGMGAYFGTYSLSPPASRPGDPAYRDKRRDSRNA